MENFIYELDDNLKALMLKVENLENELKELKEKGGRSPLDRFKARYYSIKSKLLSSFERAICGKTY